MREGKHLYEFGPFRLDPAERSLLRDGKAVPLTPKAFELLVLLVENRGHLSGLLVRRHIVAGEFHYIGKEASTRWASGTDLSMMSEAGVLDPADETFREYERVVDPKYLDGIRVGAKQFSTKLLSRTSSVAECAIRNFKNGKNTIKPRTLRKLTKTIRDLENKSITNSVSPSCLSAQ